MEKQDLEFMDELEAATQLKPAGAANLLLLAIVLFFTAGFLWAALSEVDERVRGQGAVMPSSDIQVVQSLDGGIVTEILVAEGDAVKKGQPIIRIDDLQFASEGRNIEAQITGLKAKQARLKAEAAGVEFSIDPQLAAKHPDIAANEEKLYNSRQQELKSGLGMVADEVSEIEANISEVKASIGKYARSRDSLSKELEIVRRLVAQKAQPEIEKLRLERELNEVSGNLSSASQSQRSLEARLAGARKKEGEKKAVFKSQALGELNEVESKLASIKENLVAAEDRVRRTELTAPQDGIVHKLYVKTVGGVVQPAQKLAEIVPANDALMIRARVSPADIAFLKPGQKVRVSITAYDPQIYGTLQGRLERIGADTVTNERGEVYFEIDVVTDKSYLGEATHPLPITAGMVSEAEVITGRRTVLTYLMKPVLRVRDRALTEK